MKKPNIVYILADDMGYGDLTCLNSNSKIPTPNMDAIAKNGVRFTDAHSPSAVCTPTRCGILTGRYTWRSRLKSGVLWGYSPPLIEEGRPTIASFLQQNGYRTGCIGKWHLGLGWVTSDGKVFSDRSDETGESVLFGRKITNGPIDHGFDYFFGIPASLDMEPYVYIENDRVTAVPDRRCESSERPAFYRAGPIAPDFKHQEVLPVTAKKAVSFIDDHQKNHKNKPFFLYYPLSAPHTPWMPNDHVKGKSKAGDYGDFVVEVDWVVGQIMETLKKHGLTDNTLLIVTSDNGSHWLEEWKKQYDHNANYHFRGMKADIWDGGHRIPFIAQWPGRIAEGSVCNDTVCLTDLFATVASLLGKDLPDTCAEDSFSILPGLLGKPYDTPKREVIIHHALDGMFSVRRGRWKLILGLGSGGFTAPQRIKPRPDDPPGQLYDIVNDVGETKNLYQDRPEIVEELTSLLERYRDDVHSRPFTRR